MAKGTIKASSGTGGFYSNLSLQVAYVPSSTLSTLITIYEYLLLKCLPSNRYSFLFSEEIMLFLLISGMLTYIFLLLHITITFYGLLGNTSLIRGRFFHRVFTTLAEAILFLCYNKVLCVIIYLYSGPYLLPAGWQKSVIFLVFSFGSSWFTY